MGYQNCTCPSCRPHKQPDHEPPCSPCAPWLCKEKEKDCGCKPDPCCKPEPKPAQVLIPKVICSGREWQRQLCTTLHVSGLPECAKCPFQLVSVQQSGAFPWWEPVKEDCCRDRLMYHVYIPVCCCVKDACGCEYFAPAVVELDACLRLNCNPSECWRHNLVIVPCVRMVCPPVCSNDACFEVTLEVVLELFLIHWQVLSSRPPKPECRQLPLYPQPHCQPYTS